MSEGGLVRTEGAALAELPQPRSAAVVPVGRQDGRYRILTIEVRETHTGLRARAQYEAKVYRRLAGAIEEAEAEHLAGPAMMLRQVLVIDETGDGPRIVRRFCRPEEV